MTPQPNQIEQIDSDDSTAFAAMAASGADDSEFVEGNGPWTVHGVAIGEGDVTSGVTEDGEEKPTHWPAEVLREGADGLEGRHLVDDSDHENTQAVDPPVDAIVGEVTDVAYKDGVGVVYEAEVDDPQIAKQADRGRIDVSPAIFRKRGEFDEDLGAAPAEQIVHWRDLATVANGAAPSNSITTGSAAEALQVEALQATFGPADEGGNSPEDPGATDSTSAADSTDTDTTMDLTEDEEKLIHEARATDDPAVVSADVEALAESAEEYEEPALIESDELEALTESVDEVESIMAEALAERTGLTVETAEALGLEAMRHEFENDDGEFEAEVLMQSPEAGGADDGDALGDGGGDDDVGLEALSADERTQIEDLGARAETMESVAPDHAETLRAEAADVAGVESFDEIDMEEL